jgi:leucyl aminopeptidase
MSGEPEDDVPNLFSPEDVAAMKQLTAASRQLVDYFARLPRPLTNEQRTALDRFVADLRELKVQTAFLLAATPGEAVRAALGGLTPPTGESQ